VFCASGAADEEGEVIHHEEGAQLHEDNVLEDDEDSTIPQDDGLQEAVAAGESADPQEDVEDVDGDEQ
jgi:hypothetical protein